MISKHIRSKPNLPRASFALLQVFRRFAMQRSTHAWVLLLALATAACHSAVLARDAYDIAHYSRKLAQNDPASISNDKAEFDKGVMAIPAICKVVRGSTTQQCHSTCKTCEDTSGFARSRRCVCCQPGYVPNGSAKCAKCPVGTAARPGDTECTPCPNGLTTLRAGSTTCDGECMYVICSSAIAALVTDKTIAL